MSMTGIAFMAVVTASVGANCPVDTHVPTDAIRRFSQTFGVYMLT